MTASPSLKYHRRLPQGKIGTAVLGLGQIGALAAKPVMEGKAALFKTFSGLDAIDIEINETDPNRLVTIIQSISPGFGGINLEDIKAPECFLVEEQLIKTLDIPVFHDDQHGTAIVVAAGLTNALRVAGKKITAIKTVIVGAGAAGIATARMLLNLGLNPDNLYLFDSQDLITKDRQNLNPYKQLLAQNCPPLSLSQAVKGADVFIGVSTADILTPAMLKSMANPNPEIGYQTAKQAVPGVIIATGRSDCPNQINNLLCFPYIFKGAFMARAKQITPAMKLAAVKAIAALVKNPNPDSILPKPFDRSLLTAVSAAVARAAIQ